jgi:hypothetical protein
LYERFFLFSDDRALGGHLFVKFNEWLPFFRHVVFVEDGFDRALGHARFAIDALIGVDVENLLPFVEALHGANDHAIGVLASKARFANDVRHESRSSKRKPKLQNKASGDWSIGHPFPVLAATWLNRAKFLFSKHLEAPSHHASRIVILTGGSVKRCVSKQCSVATT